MEGGGGRWEGTELVLSTANLDLEASWLPCRWLQGLEEGGEGGQCRTEVIRSGS